MKLLEATLLSQPLELPEPSEEAPQHSCLDKGYDYQAVRDLLEEWGYTAHIRTRGEERRAKGEVPGYRVRVPGAAVGGGADALVAEPVPAAAGPVGEEDRELPGAAALRLRLDHLPGCGAFRIGT
jgi:hypothetical protein